MGFRAQNDKNDIPSKTGPIGSCLRARIDPIRPKKGQKPIKTPFDPILALSQGVVCMTSPRMSILDPDRLRFACQGHGLAQKWGFGPKVPKMASRQKRVQKGSYYGLESASDDPKRAKSAKNPKKGQNEHF